MTNAATDGETPTHDEDDGCPLPPKDRSGVIAQLRPVTVLTGPDEKAIDHADQAMIDIADVIEFVDWRTEGEGVRQVPIDEPREPDHERDERDFFAATLMTDLDEHVAYMLFEHPLAGRHPRYQVGLASEIVRLATSERGEEVGEGERTADYFVIVTYSDYIIDHMRIAVRDGLLTAKDFAVIDFRFDEQPEVVTLSEHGAVVQCSARYRRWQLKEQARFLGVETDDTAGWSVSERQR